MTFDHHSIIKQKEAVICKGDNSSNVFHIWSMYRFSAQKSKKIRGGRIM